MYSLKRPTHWFWRTNFTREQVLKHLDEMKISGDWLVCPLGEANKATTVANFVSDPDNSFAGQSHVELDDANDSARELSPKPSATIPRRHDLDALRAVAMLLGIALHGALAYIPMPEGAYPVRDVRQNEMYGMFLAAVHGFRMPLFFLVSGFFTAMLWRKRGLAALLKHRVNRIFVPLLIGTFTIVPAVWFVSIAAGIAGSQIVNDDANTNVWIAVTSHDGEKLQQSLANGISPNELEPALGTTPMSIAASHGNVEAIDLLIASGADVNARDRDGGTPLHRAAMFGQAEAARVLIQHGADADARNRIGETAADMLKVDGARIHVMGMFNGIEIDDLVGREQVAAMLRQADQSSQSQSEPLTPVVAGEQLQGGLLLLMLTLPLFHHLWFLWYLCWLVAAFAVYTKAATLLNRKPPGWLVTSPIRYAWLIPLTIIPQSMMGILYPGFGPDTSTGLLPMPQILLYYVIFFIFGAMYFDCHDAVGQVGRWWRVTLPVALLVVFPLGYELTMGGFGFFGNGLLDSGWCRPLSVVLQVVYAWLMSFGLMGLFRELFSQESKVMRYVSDSSYWLYLAHLPLIIVAHAVTRSWQIPAFAKLILVCTFTSALLLASYQLCVRYTPIGTLLNGPRKRSESIATTEAIGAQT
jgi:fucose 4-O-acetylase-like acetyltransferase